MNMQAMNAMPHRLSIAYGVTRPADSLALG